jgi:hypothetical protein
MAHIAVLRSGDDLGYLLLVACVACVVYLELCADFEIASFIDKSFYIGQLVAVEAVLFLFKQNVYMLLMVELHIRGLVVKLRTAEQKNRQNQ